MLRVDRTDPSKNAVRGFAAFGRLLELEPELDGRIQLARAARSRRGRRFPEYVDYRHATEAAAAAVNDRFGTPGWQPVRLDVRDDFPASVAAFLEYDVLLVNPVKDGLNLVAKEAPLVNERDGVGRPLARGRRVRGAATTGCSGSTRSTSRSRPRPCAPRSGSRARSASARGAAIRDHVRTHDLDAWAEGELDELARRTTPDVREQAGYDGRRERTATSTRPGGHLLSDETTDRTRR